MIYVFTMLFSKLYLFLVFTLAYSKYRYNVLLLSLARSFKHLFKEFNTKFTFSLLLCFISSVRFAL